MGSVEYTLKNLLMVLARLYLTSGGYFTLAMFTEAHGHGSLAQVSRVCY